jgi:hypothetical protein
MDYMEKIPKWLYFIFLLLSIASCKRTDKDIPNTGNVSNEIWKTVGVAGQVIDEESKPLPGASVKFGNQTITTDINGYFRFNQASFSTEQAFLTVAKAGYFNGTRTFIPRAGSNNYLKIQLLARKIIGTVDATAGGAITMSNGISIKLPGNGIINGRNLPVEGKVTVTAAYIDPNLADASLKMPGDNIGISSGNTKKLLKSFGMIAIELTSSTGEKLNIRTGYKATLQLPIPFDPSLPAPTSISLSSFDESTGMWKEEGQAVRQGDFYIGLVSHFSFWNMNLPLDFVKFSMRLVGANGSRVEGATVKLTSLLTRIETFDLTDNLGYCDGYIPSGEGLVMQVFDNCQTEILNKSIGPFTTDTDLGDVPLAGSVTLQTITGKVQNCDGQPLKVGTLQVVLDNNHFEFTNIQDGNFNITFLNCMGSSSVNLIAIDESLMQRSESVPLVLSGNGTNVGVLQACGVEIPAYFNIYIDGVDQTWTNTVFGGWIDTTTSFGDNSNPVTLFKGDTTLYRKGLTLNVKLYNPIHLPDSANLISISIDRASAIWYQPIDVRNFMIEFYAFGDVGKIIEGNFEGRFEKLQGCCPNSTVLDTVNISAQFRFRRDKQWWTP